MNLTSLHHSFSHLYDNTSSPCQLEVCVFMSCVQNHVLFIFQVTWDLQLKDLQRLVYLVSIVQDQTGLTPNYSITQDCKGQKKLLKEIMVCLM